MEEVPAHRRVVNLRLTREDYQNLILALGYAVGTAQTRNDTADLLSWLEELSDWILIQGGTETRTYFHDRSTLEAKKIAEIEDLG